MNELTDQPWTSKDLVFILSGVVAVLSYGLLHINEVRSTLAFTHIHHSLAQNQTHILSHSRTANPGFQLALIFSLPWLSSYTWLAHLVPPLRLFCGIGFCCLILRYVVIRFGRSAPLSFYLAFAVLVGTSEVMQLLELTPEQIASAVPVDPEIVGLTG